MASKRGTLSPEQVSHLLKPIKATRVLRDGKGHSHVSQQDITAHLVRMFGFGNFDVTVSEVGMLFETSEVKTSRAGKEYVAWDVAYRALVVLTIRNEHGETVATYENGSVGSASSQPSRADAHDLAYKSSISLSIKRAAIALGDQFGLSLYNKGQTSALVIRTVVGGDPVDDVQADIPQQLVLGNDEVDRGEEVAPVAPVAPARDAVDSADTMKQIDTAKTEDELNLIYQSIIESGRMVTDIERASLSKRKSLIKDGL